MLIDQAVIFEDSVKNVKKVKNVRGQQAQDQLGNITWDNAEELQAYISRVQEAANNIMNENRRLRKLHLKLVDIVVQLFDVDLIKQRHVWMERLDFIKKTIDLGCANKDAKLCVIWRIHWDF